MLSLRVRIPRPLALMGPFTRNKLYCEIADNRPLQEISLPTTVLIRELMLRARNSDQVISGREHMQEFTVLMITGIIGIMYELHTGFRIDSCGK